MRLYFTFLIIYFLPATSIALTYYVSPTGKNTNSGTSVSSPWQTITQINKKNFIGDTILFQGGNTFSGSIGFTSVDVGTPTKPIVVGSYGTGLATISSGNSYGISIYNTAGFKIKNLIFKGSGRTINTQSGILIYMDKALTRLPYIKIDSVEVYGYRNSGISIGSWNQASGFDDVSVTNSLSHDNGSAGISTYAQVNYVHKNLYVAYNKVYNNPGIPENTTGNSGSGIVLGNVDGAVIEYCTSYNNGWLHSNSYGGPNGIWAYASNNVTIQFNESHHNKTGNTRDGGGFDFDGGCTNSIMQYNYSHDNDGAGYLMANYDGAPLMKNIIVRYNISENDGRKNDYGAIHISAPGSHVGFQMLEIYNNTVYLTTNLTGNKSKAFFIRSGKLSGVNIRNNIFQTTGGIQLVSVGSTSGCNFQGNNFWSTGSTFKIYWGGTTYSSLTSWRTATGQEKINGTSSGLQSDPRFSDTTTGVTFNDATRLTTITRYKLKSTSDLITKGLNLTSLFGLNVGTRDFWGNSLINKSTYNIGAYQLALLCPSISAVVCPSVVKNLPLTINFTGSESGLMDKNQAATGFSMVDKPSAPLVTPTHLNFPGYEPSKLQIVAGKLTITTTSGISYLNPAQSSGTNSQVNALGVGFVAPSKFTIQTTLAQPNAGTGKSEQAGLWFGLDEDNFVKLVVVSAGSGNSKVEMRKEVTAISTATDIKSSGSLILSSSLVKLKFLIDKVANTIAGIYSINGGSEISLGTLSIPQSFTAGKTLSDGVTKNITFGGIYATHRSATTALNFSFEDFKVEAVTTTAPLSLNADNSNFSIAQGDPSSSTIVAFENNFETLKIYPNPLHKRFNIQFPGTYRGNFTLQIVDQLGKIYEIGKYRSGEGRSNMEVDISNLLLKAGIYSLRIHSNNSKTEVIKLIIQ
jgi:hypothetical protein